jgi:hypothetical protein
MPLHWSKQALASLSPRRGDVRAPRLDYDEAALVKGVKASFAKYVAGFRAGIARGPAEGKALTERVIAAVEEMTPGTALEADVQGAIARVAGIAGSHDNRLERDLVRHWIARRGLAFAVEALFELGTLDLQHLRIDGRVLYDVSWIGRVEGWDLFGFQADGPREDVTRAIAAADEADYRAVVLAVGSLRTRTQRPSLRCALDALVLTERAWAGEDVAQVLAEPATTHARDLGPAVRLFSALDPDAGEALLTRAVANTRTLADGVFDAVRSLEDRALPHLVAAVAGFEAAAPKANDGLAEARQVARALAVYNDPRAAAAFTAWVGDAQSIGPVAVEYMQTFPGLATSALAPLSLEKTRKGEAARSLLLRIVRVDPAAVAGAVESLPADQRSAVQRMMDAAAQADAMDEAPPEALPTVLREPPWRKSKARPVLPVVEGLGPLAYEERVAWTDEAERARAARTPIWARYGPLAGEDLARLEDNLRDDAASTAIPYARRPVPWERLDDETALRLWQQTSPKLRIPLESEIGHMLARFGARAIGGAAAAALALMSEVAFEHVVRCDSPVVAPVVLKGLGRAGLRRACAAWLEEHPEAATLGLLPIALAPPSREKADAGAVLRHLASRGARPTILAAASRWSEPVALAAAAVLDFDPLLDCPTSPPKLSAFANVEELPPLLLADGRRVPDTAKRSLLEMLQFTPFEPPYAGIAQVRGVFDTASLDRLLLAVVDAWVAAGAATASAWALRAVAHVGSDAIARDIATSVRRWLREKGKPRALLGVAVLGRMGTDVALMHLSDLSRTARNRAVEGAADQALSAASQARGLTSEQLEDRLTPTLDLDDRGTTTLDFGPRQFVVRVDEHLQPRIFDGDALLPSLPRSTKNDDAVKGKAASARFKALKADLETVGKTLLARLERAMLTGRRWEKQEYRALLVDHPLAGRVARRLVWGAFDGPARGVLTTSFRVAEDATLAGSDDDSFTLPEGAQIGIVHPLELSEALRVQWGTILGDYELVQPFDQIGRPTYTITAGERGAKSLTRFGGRAVPSGPFLGRLETRGWRRGPVGEGWIDSFQKDFGGVVAVASFSPPLDVRGKPPDACTLDSVTFDGATLGELPPIVFSEVAFDLAPLAPRASP